MTEREIRRIVEDLCAELDRRARSLGRAVVPGVVGAVAFGSLALGLAGCGDRGTPQPDGKSGDGRAGDGKTVDKQARWENPPQPPYMAPVDAAYGVPPPDRQLQRDLFKPPPPPYMAPDIGPPQPDYMPPWVDGGVQPLYMPPPPKKDK